MSNLKDKQVPIIKKHPDGEWWTTETEYKGYRLMIKMLKNRGARIYVFGSPEKVIKTIKYSFCTPELLIEDAKKWIDKYLKINQP